MFLRKSIAQAMGKDTKNCKRRSCSMTHPEGQLLRKLSYRPVLMIMAGITALFIMIYRQRVESGDDSLSKQTISPSLEELPELQWNYSSFSFHPNVSDWDDQRVEWAERNGYDKQGARAVLMVTSSSPEPSDSSIMSHLLLRAGKNKLNYCQFHDITLFYNLGASDHQFNDRWEKLPLMRMLMLQHPEVDWIWWMDSDAVLTNISFEPPFAELKHYNLVFYEEDTLVYSPRPSISLNTANFMIRNCQWSLDLLDAWASMGTASGREDSGKFLSELLFDREAGLPGDDESGLLAILAQDQRLAADLQRWVPLVKPLKEGERAVSDDVAMGESETRNDKTSGRVLPGMAHFAGCLPTFGGARAAIDASSEQVTECQEKLMRAFDLADSQVYGQLGFQSRLPGKSLEPMTRLPSETGKDEQHNNSKEYWLPPKYSDWDERRQVWMEKHPETKKKALLTSGSAPGPCRKGKISSQILIRGLKNVIDYGRTNGFKFFYNDNVIHKDLIGWWSKLPLLKTLMINNPSVEWMWWIDSDAVFTDMDFQLPFSSYDDAGYNVVLYGDDSLVYGNRSFAGINTGNFLIRNCQWSLDLLDRWASFGATEELRIENMELLHNALPDRPSRWKADDQSVLVYLLIAEREKWGSQVRFERVIAMSGHWHYWVPRFETAEYRPFVTHFAGCQPCSEFRSDNYGLCMDGMGRAYNHADNQVLAKYGIRHEALNSSVLQKIGTIGGTAAPSAEAGDSDRSGAPSTAIET